MKRYVMLGLLLVFLPGCQSGCFSRVGIGESKLPVPKDCQKVISLGHSGKIGKYLSYLSTDGTVKMKEYSDFGVLEAEYTLDGATFNANLERVWK